VAANDLIGIKSNEEHCLCLIMPMGLGMSVRFDAYTIDRNQQFPLIPWSPLFSSIQDPLWAFDISIKAKSSLNHAQNGVDKKSGHRLCRDLSAPSLL
jgi:hypothetical protein